MAVARDSSSSRQIGHWDRIREAFGLHGAAPQQPPSAAAIHWETLCNVILPERNMADAPGMSQEILQEPEGEVRRTNSSSNEDPPPPPVSEALKEPSDETLNNAVHTPPTDADASTDSAVANARLQSEADMTPSGPETPAERPVAWGSAEEMEALNKDIQECLEIEGVASPSSFFPESVQDFPSVGHYYIEVMNRLDAAGIDLFESFVGHLGEAHPLVKSMTEILPERKPQTLLVREPSLARQERHQEATVIAVPGLQEFSNECRALSWVIRTGERSVPPADASGRNRVGGLSVIESITGGSRREQGHRCGTDKGSSSVVCPLGDNFQDPNQPQPEPSVSVARRKKALPALWTRFRSCFCFAAS